MKIKCRFKATIVGCGSVGATIAHSFLLSGTVTDLALIDVNAGKAEGLCLDLEHARPFTPSLDIVAGGDSHLAEGSHVVIVTAGKRQAEGETRLDLLKANRAIFQEMIPPLVQAAPQAIFLIVTNPVDVLTYDAIKLANLPAGRVFGSGTVLDSARLQFHLSKTLGIHPSSIDAYVLGEHGDTSFPVYSTANVLGKPLTDFPGFTAEVARQCYEDTRQAAYRIIHDQGYTCYSIAVTVREIVTAIFEDQKRVLPLSVALEDYYGHTDVCLSVPCVLGSNGIEKILHVPLDKEESANLDKSVKTIKFYL